MGWAIALHGGAGDIPLSLPPESRQPREEALHHCLQIGVEALKAKMPPLDVVELVVRLKPHTLYLCPFFLFRKLQRNKKKWSVLGLVLWEKFLTDLDMLSVVYYINCCISIRLIYYSYSIEKFSL